jgi:hypothetical protein
MMTLNELTDRERFVLQTLIDNELNIKGGVKDQLRQVTKDYQESPAFKEAYDRLDGYARELSDLFVKLSKR